MLALSTRCQRWLLVANVAIALTETHGAPLRTSHENFLQAHGRLRKTNGLASRLSPWVDAAHGSSKHHGRAARTLAVFAKEAPIEDLPDDGSDAINFSSLRKAEGLVDIYTNPFDRQVLLLNLTSLIADNTHVLVTASWSRGTFNDDDGQNTILHEPVGGTEATMLRFKYSKDGSVDVIQPRVSLRTSDKQARKALNQGAWSGWEDSLKVLPSDDGSLIVDGTSFLGNGFYTQGWTLLQSIVDFRVSSVKSYPTNILVTCAMQLENEDGGRVPVQISFSLVALPSVPMPSRPSDDRLGFFSVDYLDVGQHPPENPHQLSAAIDLETSVIVRFDLSRGGKRQEIRFYIDPTVPQRWWRYFKEGVEAWNAAFARAGRPHTMHAVMPTDEDWPEDYDRDDARYSTISWSIDMESTYALGLAKVDPRSGQILKSDIVVTNGWVRSWLHSVEVAAPEIVQHTDTLNMYRREDRRQKAPWQGRRGAPQAKPSRGVHQSNHSFHFSDFHFPSRPWLHHEDDWEEVVGAGLRSVVMHETGHSLGLRHNFKASTAIGKDCLSNINCTAQRGVSVSVMDYMPINIYAIGQPAESRPDLFSAVVGEYDKRAIEYGYTAVPPAERTGPLDFSPALEKILESAEWLPFCTDEDLQAGNDPSCKQHDLSSNPVEYHRTMLDMLTKEAKSLMNTSVAPGQSYTLFGEAFESIVGKVEYIASELVEWIGGLDTNAVHRMENGEYSKHKGVDVISYQTQLDALHIVTDIIHQEYSILPTGADLQYLLARVGDIGVRAIDMQETVRRLRVRLVNDLTTSDVLRRIRKASSINASSMDVGSYLHELTDRFLLRSSPNGTRDAGWWDVQAAYFRNLKQLYFGHCSEADEVEDGDDDTVPMEIVTIARVQLKRAERSFLEQTKKAPPTWRGYMGGADPETDRESFLMRMKAELSDLDQPCSARVSKISQPATTEM